jgi:hypothetical protein
VRIVVHTYNPSTWEAKAGGPQIQGQPGIHSKTQFQKKKKTIKHNAKPYYSIFICNSENGQNNPEVLQQMND